MSIENNTAELQALLDEVNNLPAAGSGEPGADGVTFTPHIDESGNLSWTNDGGRTNPATVNIKGPKGDDGSKGESIASVTSYPDPLDEDNNLVAFYLGTGQQVGIVGVRNGSKGDPGADGVSPTVSVSAISGGHRITIRAVNGTKTIDVMDGTTFIPGDTLSLDPETGVLSVNTADNVEQDNTLPITSAAVFETVGNIEVLLKTI